MELKCASSTPIFADKLRGPFKKITEVLSDKNVEIKLHLSIAYFDIDIFGHSPKFTFRLMLDLKPEYELQMIEELQKLKKFDKMSSFICTINSKDLQTLSAVFAGILTLTIEASSLFYLDTKCYTERSMQDMIGIINELTQNYKINIVRIDHIYDLFLLTGIKCNYICIRRSRIESDEDLYAGIDLALLYFEKTNVVRITFDSMSTEEYEKNCKTVATYLEDQPYQVEELRLINNWINIQKKTSEF